ncbi:hypothetical protein B0H10DRAFT_2332279 [Mycena sp. CBHHK59/15]|nr:hypothetical protein B0H10DRAFT_2332279 [Mycena sp. CBHHK59/15]
MPNPNTERGHSIFTGGELGNATRGDPDSREIVQAGPTPGRSARRGENPRSVDTRPATRIAVVFILRQRAPDERVQTRLEGTPKRHRGNMESAGRNLTGNTPEQRADRPPDTQRVKGSREDAGRFERVAAVQQLDGDTSKSKSEEQSASVRKRDLRCSRETGTLGRDATLANGQRRMLFCNFVQSMTKFNLLKCTPEYGTSAASSIDSPRYQIPDPATNRSSTGAASLDIRPSVRSASRHLKSKPPRPIGLQRRPLGITVDRRRPNIEPPRSSTGAASLDIRPSTRSASPSIDSARILNPRDQSVFNGCSVAGYSTQYPLGVTVT